MEQNEGLPVAKAGLTRTLQACQRCRSLKTRCLPSSQSGSCQRCFASGNECAWADTPRRARKLRAPSRIAQVEQKIDGLVAKLVSASDNDLPSGSASASPSVTPETRTELRRRHRTVAPDSWVPTSSFDPIASHLETHVDQPSENAEVDRHYLDGIRAVHRFGDHENSGQIPDGPFRETKHREEPIDDELAKHLLASGEAELLMNEYRHMSTTFPFVVIPKRLTSMDLHAERPMLFLAIMTVASWKDYSQQKKLDVIYRTELAHRTIVQPRRTFGLVQSLLVYLSWYHFVFSHKTQQIFFLHHLVIGLALDIGLHQDYQPLKLSTPLRPIPPPPTAIELRERQRAFLGCYYLPSMVGAALQKPNLLKHTPSMAEMAQKLNQEREYESDETISHLISLRQIDDQMQDTLFTAAAAQFSLSDGRTLMHLRFMEAQLDTWKTNIHGVTTQRLLLLSFSFSKMLLHSIVLRPHRLDHPPPPNSAQLDSLYSTLEAGRTFLDTLLSFQTHDYHLVSFSEWMRLPPVIMTVAKLCMPSDNHISCGWDVQAAQDRMRLDLCLESLCYRMQTLSTYDKAKQPHTDFWRAMQFILDLTRNWYIRKIQLQAPIQTPPQTAHGIATGPSMSESSCPISGPSTNPSAHRTRDQFKAFDDIAFMAEACTEPEADSSDSGDPFALMKSVDFDMEQFFDMAGGIWGDQSYNSYSDMAFGEKPPF